MVKIGEVEFLVKFDTLGRRFKDVFTDALKDVDMGTDSQLMDKVNDIWFDMKQQFRITGTDRTFPQFIQTDLENIRNWWSNKENMRQLAKDIMASPRGPAMLGIPEEQWGETEVVQEKVEMYRDLLFSRLERMAESPEYWRKNASNINQFLTAAERIMGSKNIVENIGKFNLLIDEYENVTRQLTSILDKLGIEYLSKGHGGERQFQIQYGDIGTGGDKPLTAGMFWDMLIKKAGPERTKAMVERTEGIKAVDRPFWKGILNDIFSQGFFIPTGQAIPIPIAKLLVEDMINELKDVVPEDIYRTRGPDIRTAEDILVFFKSDEGKKFFEEVKEKFGEGWEEILTTYGLIEGREGGLLIESKKTSTAEIKPEFIGQQVIAGVKTRIDERFHDVGLKIEEDLKSFDIDKAKEDIIKTLGRKIENEMKVFPGLLEKVEESVKSISRVYDG